MNDPVSHEPAQNMIRFTFRQPGLKRKTQLIVLMIGDKDYDTSLFSPNVKTAMHTAVLCSNCFDKNRTTNDRPDMIPLVFGIRTEIFDENTYQALIIHTTDGLIETTMILDPDEERATLFAADLNERSLLSKQEKEQIIKMSIEATENKSTRAIAELQPTPRLRH